ncbi:MAG: T9SS type A sorting domain-containing protein [Candidatus Kapabacteria bacterium]|nr:T9SS type A sorting domain-containing protein [Candidatus Kapabacteria bacterium]
MKKCILFSVMCVLFNLAILHADNWEPYPYGKSLIYTTDYTFGYGDGYGYTQEQASLKGQYFTVRFDSVSIDESGNKTYYSERYLRQHNFPCINDTMDIFGRFKAANGWGPAIYYFQEDIYTIKKDTAIFHLLFIETDSWDAKITKNDQIDIAFPLNLQVGDEYIQKPADNYSAISTKCISRTNSLTFNLEDSVAIYVVNWGDNSIDTIVFSKQFGFIDFIPITALRYFNDTRITLAGIKDEQQSLGVQMPDSLRDDQIMNYKAGDIIKWESQTYKNYYHRRDSIISVERTADSIIITCARTEINTVIPFIDGYSNPHQPPYNPYWTKTSTQREAYPLKELLYVFNAPTNDFLLLSTSYFADEQKNFKQVVHKLCQKPVIYGSDTALALSYYEGESDLLYVDEQNCQIDHILVDGGYYLFQLDSKFGITREGYILPVSLKHYDLTVWVEYEDDWIEIVGYRSNGEVWGDISMPDTTALEIPGILISVELDKNNHYSVSPNPARDYIYINSSLIDGVGVWEYQIYDLLGNCIQSGLIESDKINISQLSTGFYTVRFFNDGKQVVEKMMKE